MTDHPLDQLHAFALGDLDLAAARDVLAHADSCPSCAAVLAEAMRGVSVLSASDGERADAPRPLRLLKRRPSWALFGASLAAALALAVWNVDLRSTEHPAPIDALVHSHFTHHPLTGNGGDAKLITALDGSWLYVVADGLRPWSVYTLRVDDAEIGSVRADFAGKATGYWAHAAGVIRSAELDGPGGAQLRWRDK